MAVVQAWAMLVAGLAWGQAAIMGTECRARSPVLNVQVLVYSCGQDRGRIEQVLSAAYAMHMPAGPDGVSCTHTVYLVDSHRQVHAGMPCLSVLLLRAGRPTWATDQLKNLFVSG